MMAKEKIIGIDLGTSNSQAAIMIGGKPTIIPSAEGATVAGKMFPSVVGFAKDGQVLVGEPARRQAVTNPKGTVMGAKRKMGTDFKYEINGKNYTPQQISAFILQKIKKDAEAFLGEKVTKAVITVPAYFNDNQRTATKDAGKIAGLDVVRLVNEPTAASMAYGLDKEGSYKIMVFDLGGGTLDVTIMEFGDGTFTVLSTSGDTELGGTDMDSAIINWIYKEFNDKEGVDLSLDKTAVQRVREAAEKAKIELSTVTESEINLPYITANQDGPKHLSMKLTRAKLESLISHLLAKCKKPMEQALKDAKLDNKGVDRIILVGGPTRMPSVQKLVEDFTGKTPEKTIDPMECVAMGAAIQGAILSGDVKDMVLLDVTPLTLGLETLGEVMTPLIPRNTTIPTKKSQVFSTAADMQTAVTVKVLQGERPRAADNTSLGEFNLVGIPPAPRGVPQIEVTFDIDASGILNVSAKDLGTGKEQKMTITASTKLSDAEIEKMTKAAKANEEADKKFKEETDTRNEAEALIYQMDKMMSDLGDKIDNKTKDELNKEKDELKKMIDSKDTAGLKKKMEEFTKKLQEAGASMYKKAQAPKEDNKNKEQDKENVVDADYKVD